MIFDVYIKDEVISSFEFLAESFGEKRLEAMGLLLGKCFSLNGKKWVIVDELITSQTDSSAVSVRFSEKFFEELVREYGKNKSGKIIIGWIHSHPGYGCFLSGTDLATQKSYFSKDFNVAFVVDPKKTENGKMLKRAYRLDENKSGYKEVSFAVLK